MRFDIRGSFFFNSSDNDVIALRARSIEHEEREASVASDEAEFSLCSHDVELRASSPVLARTTTTEGAPLLRSLQGWEPRTSIFGFDLIKHSASHPFNCAQGRLFRKVRERVGTHFVDGASEVKSLDHPSDELKSCDRNPHASQSKTKSTVEPSRTPKAR